MMNLSVPLIALLIALPVVSGPFLWRMRDASRARRAAIILAAVTLALALSLALLARTSAEGVADPAIPWLLGPSRSLFAVDHLSAPLLPFVALVALALVVASPRRHATPASLGALLLAEGFTLGIFASLNFGVLAVFWVMALLPGYRLTRESSGPGRQARTRRTWAGFLALNALLLAVTTLLLSSAGAPGAIFLPGFEAPGDGRIATAAALLLGLLVLVRSGVVPTYAWLPELIKQGPLSVTVLLFVSQPGPYLVARLILPAFAHTDGRPLALLGGLGLLIALLGALAGLAQRDLKRIIAALTLSQTGMILVGLCADEPKGITGALVQWLAIGVSVTGLSLCAAAIEARTETTDASAQGGLAQRAPRLATALLLFGAASVGFPGTLGFIGEDMLIHGLVEVSPLIAGGLILVTVVNGIVFVRFFMRAFLGPRASEAPIADLLPRERFAALGLLLALVGFGLFPSGLVHAQAGVAQGLVQQGGQVTAPQR